jgi:hypothetical protein
MISKLLSCLPEAREKFYNAGFDLPRLYLRMIEGVRTREGWERNYEGYLDQVAFEYCALAHPWQPAMRRTLLASNRSQYLDLLAVRDDVSRFSLDPNFNAFIKTGADTDAEVLNVLRDQKSREWQSIAVRSHPCEGAKDNLACFSEIARDHGFCAENDFKPVDNKIDCISRNESAYCFRIRVMDIVGLRRRGNVFVQYFFSDLGDRPFGLGMFIPGGDLYCTYNKSDDMVKFSFLVQCKFAAILNSVVGRAGEN